MKTIRFTSRAHLYSGYGCSEPGDQDGEYVRADVAKALLAACEDFLYGRKEARECEADMRAAIAKAKEGQ